MMPSNTDTAHRTLDRPPAAEARSIQALVRDVLEGRVRIPGWQRGIKWEGEDARKLIDSLYRGYPAGTLLFWKRDGPSEEITIGTTQIAAPPRSDALYVVDGQQRITSLVRVLAGRNAADEPFSMYFDFSRGEIVLSPREGPDPAWLPMSEVLDSRHLIRWLLAHPEAPQEVAIEVGTRIREYQIPAYVVETDREAAVREIFERTNNTGKRLDANEVFDGRFRGLHATEPAGLRDVAMALAAEGLGELEREQLHSMMLAMRFTDPTKADTSGWDAKQAHQALVDLQQAGVRTLRFLAHDAGIPHLGLLPYAQPLLALARFFHLHPSPHARNRSLLARWVWRGATAGLHGGASVGTRATLSAIDKREDESVQALLRLVEEGRDSMFDARVEQFRATSARSTICSLGLARLEPRHLISGDALDLLTVVPLQVTQHAKGKSRLGNRLLHPLVPGGLRRAILDCTSIDVLHSHGITLEAQALLRDNVDAFIAEREVRLVGHIDRMVERLTAWNESDRPPLRALWDDE